MTRVVVRVSCIYICGVLFLLAGKFIAIYAKFPTPSKDQGDAALCEFANKIQDCVASCAFIF